MSLRDLAVKRGTLPPAPEPQDETHPAFLDRVSGAARTRALSAMSAARRNPLLTSQREIDSMTDDEKWEYLGAVCQTEEELRNRAAQTTMEDEGQHVRDA